MLFWISKYPEHIHQRRPVHIVHGLHRLAAICSVTLDRCGIGFDGLGHDRREADGFGTGHGGGMQLEGGRFLSRPCQTDVGRSVKACHEGEHKSPRERKLALWRRAWSQACDGNGLPERFIPWIQEGRAMRAQ